MDEDFLWKAFGVTYESWEEVPSSWKREVVKALLLGKTVTFRVNDKPVSIRMENGKLIQL